MSPSLVAVTEHTLSEHDILLGRGSGPNMQRGNMNLRNLVWQVYINELRAAAPKYEGFSFEDVAGHKPSSFPLPLPFIKARICRRVLSEVQALGGKFLRKVSLESLQSGGDKAGASKMTKSSTSNKAVYLVRNHNYPSFHAIEVPMQESKGKIRQALRFQMDQRPRREREIRSSSSSEAFPSFAPGSGGSIRREHEALDRRMQKTNDLAIQSHLCSMFTGNGARQTALTIQDSSSNMTTQALHAAIATNAAGLGLTPATAMTVQAASTPAFPATNGAPFNTDLQSLSKAISILLGDVGTHNPGASSVQPPPLHPLQLPSQQMPPYIADLLVALSKSSGSSMSENKAPSWSQNSVTYSRPDQTASLPSLHPSSHSSPLSSKVSLSSSRNTQGWGSEKN